MPHHPVWNPGDFRDQHERDHEETDGIVEYGDPEVQDKHVPLDRFHLIGSFEQDTHESDEVGRGGDDSDEVEREGQEGRG